MMIYALQVPLNVYMATGYGLPSAAPAASTGSLGLLRSPALPEEAVPGNCRMK